MSPWVKSTSGEWLDLLGLNLAGSYFATPRNGVYAIWYKTPSQSPVIKVGQGNIAERLAAERTNPEVLKFASLGPLKVSWWPADEQATRNGIEAFLSEKYSPILGSQRFDPSVPRIAATIQ